ncbi:MAG: LysM peptidoglycan-binding domain-containing protein [Puniceicoccales bacterium]|nr:LysM peptidoglycan-binding domain-containing protein [Puniceicoccales bacterium]
MKISRWVFSLIWVGLTGCQNAKQIVAETEEPLFQQGQQFLNENRPEEAFKVFQNLLERRNGEGPNTHFELGQLCLSVRRDPIFAIYHFRQHLVQDPESKVAHMVLQMIETAKKEFARTLPLSDHYNESPEYLNLIEVLKQVRAENNQLKSKLAQLKNRVTKAEIPTAHTMVVQTNEEIHNSHIERTYVVQSEDTLSKISLKMYGSAVKWKVIFDANQDVLSSPNGLKIGMKLRIPALKQ